MSNKDVKDPSKRDFLGKVTAAVAGGGAAAACWPFIQSMNPSQDVLAKATTEVDLGEIPEGTAKTVSWQGKPVFIVHRTAKQIEEMEKSKGGKEPQADSERVQKKEWLVLIGVCTHLGCVPNLRDVGWFCPCHGSIYDLSGRVLGGPAPKNLDIPPYQITDNNKLIIGKV